MWTNFALRPPIEVTGVMVNIEQKITCRVHNSQKLYFKIKISFKLYEPVAEAMPDQAEQAKDQSKAIDSKWAKKIGRRNWGPCYF